jgi:hypothetical protein
LPSVIEHYLGGLKIIIRLAEPFLGSLLHSYEL